MISNKKNVNIAIIGLGQIGIYLYNDLKKKCENEIKLNGRINVRKSGTESLVRIMVESNDALITQSISDKLENLAKNLS